MRYLIQHRKEFIITVGVFVTVALVVLWAVMAIIKGSFDLKNVAALAAMIFEILGWYYNMPTSEANSKATSRMRYEKAELIRLNNLEDGVFEEDPDGWDPDEEEDEEEEDPEEVIDDDDSC